MTALTCRSAIRRLSAYGDRELPIPDQIAIKAHLDGCPACAGELRRLEAITAALRSGARRSHATDGSDALGAIRAAVLERVAAEREQGWDAWGRRLLGDGHVVWAALGATAATVACLAVVVSLLNVASPERADSMAAILNSLGSPGSNENPLRLDERLRVPRIYPDALMPAMLTPAMINEPDAVVALSGVVTREGRMTDLALLRSTQPDEATDANRRAVAHVVTLASGTRFEPARFTGNAAPVAVNVVWLLAHTTVRGKI